MTNEAIIINGYKTTGDFEIDIAMFLALTIEYNEFSIKEMKHILISLLPYANDEDVHFLLELFTIYPLKNKSELIHLSQKLFEISPSIKSHYTDFIA